MLSRRVISWGWVVGFVCLCLCLHAHASKRKAEVSEELLGKIRQLSELKEKALLEKSELELQINSQSDPLWVEMTLMKGLGLVPEGKKKIHFTRAL